MTKLIFATHNPNKLKEIQAILPDFELQSLTDVDIHEEIPEHEDTLEGNALVKARFVYNKLGVNCFADDTGLEVDALNGEPGVFSARYAGSTNDSEQNMNKLLEKLGQNKNRKARFRTIVALILDGEEFLFEGIAEGDITHSKHGKEGFGYDPIFKPQGFEKTFAQMDLIEKNSISHRKRAVQKLVDFLREH